MEHKIASNLSYKQSHIIGPDSSIDTSSKVICYLY